MFYDPTGKRWRRVRSAAAGLILVAATSCGYVQWNTPKIPPPAAVAVGNPQIDPASVGKPQQLGSGPLVRVLRIKAGVGYDPFTGARVRALGAWERNHVKTQYVIDQYGYQPNSDHVIQLTFDDGPSPEWTRKVLDILEREDVKATFFVVGEQVREFPELVTQELRLGHAVANHSATHADLSAATSAKLRDELTSTDNDLRKNAQLVANFYRPPYAGETDADRQHMLPAILRAQRLGYVTANYTFTTQDWDRKLRPTADSFPLPDLDGQNETVLMHDAGGSRQATVDYLPKLIKMAKAKGYRFETMVQSAGAEVLTQGKAYPSVKERLTPSPDTLTTAIRWMFYLALCSLIGTGVFNISLALHRRRRNRRAPRADPGTALVTVAIAAYQEQDVIEGTLRSICASDYPNLEVIVVDDGSNDNTSAVVQAFMEQDNRVRLVHQRNAGKATALNRAFAEAGGEIVATFDADTQVQPDTIRNLLCPFVGRPEVAAVAGAIMVGNPNSMLTKWQKLEYSTQIGLERAASDVLGAIMVVPGAAGAWRRSAVLEVGGYSTETLAEDSDLCISLQAAGYRVTQADDAVAWTEAPEGLRALLQQRYRWCHGSIQVLVKHRRMLFNVDNGWLGMWTMPFAAYGLIASLVLSPLVYTVAVLAVIHQGIMTVVPFMVLFVAIQLVINAVGLLLMGQPLRLLWMVWFDRLVYDPFRLFTIYKSIYMAMNGRLVGWGKLHRTGSVQTGLPMERLVS